MKTIKLVRVQGYVLVVLATMLWGTMGVIGKIAYSIGASPELLMCYRTGLVVPIAIYIVLKYRPIHTLQLVFMGLSCIAPLYLSYFYAVKLVGASTAVLILYTAPAIVAITSKFVLREKLFKSKVVAITLCIIGTSLLSYQYIRTNILGIAIAFIAALTYAMYIVWTRYLVYIKKERPSVTTFIPIATAFPLIAIISALRREIMITSLFILAIVLYLAYITTALAYYLYAKGLKLIEASRAGILSTLEPLTAMILSVILLQEPMTISKVIGGILILISAILATYEKRV